MNRYRAMIIKVNPGLHIVYIKFVIISAYTYTKKMFFSEEMHIEKATSEYTLFHIIRKFHRYNEL